MQAATLGSLFKIPSLIFWGVFGGVLYTYFGYPLFMFLLAELGHKSKAYPVGRPPVTLLIAA
jgi:hypothetical protein